MRGAEERQPAPLGPLHRTALEVPTDDAIECYPRGGAVVRLMVLATAKAVPVDFQTIGIFDVGRTRFPRGSEAALGEIWLVCFVKHTANEAGEHHIDWSQISAHGRPPRKMPSHRLVLPPANGHVCQLIPLDALGMEGDYTFEVSVRGTDAVDRVSLTVVDD